MATVQAALAAMGHNRAMSAGVDALSEGGAASEAERRAFRYDAFISYSHSAAVGLPAALQRGLERFAKKAWQPRALRVYRDQTDLSASPGLWPEIQEALDDARFLVLLASPAAARSPWVGQEVGRWLATKGPESILIALVEGTLSWSSEQERFDPAASSAIVPALVTAFSEEPLYVDLTWTAESREPDLHHAQFRADVATLAAPIHGRTKRELEDVDVRENRRVRRFRASAIAGLAVLLVASLLGAGIAISQRNHARHQTALAAGPRSSRRRSLAAGDPFAAAALGVEAEASTSPALPEARDVFVRSMQRLGALGLSPVGGKVRAHTGPTRAVSFSMDGTVIASGGGDQLVRLWDAGTGAAVGPPLTGAAGPISTLAFGDRRLAAGDEEGGVELWELPATEPAATVIPAVQGKVTALAWSNDGRLAIGSLAGDVVVIEPGDGGWSTPALVARLPGVTALELDRRRSRARVRRPGAGDGDRRRRGRRGPLPLLHPPQRRGRGRHPRGGLRAGRHASRDRRRQRGAADLGRRDRCSDRRSVLRLWGPDGLVAGGHLAPVGGRDRHPGQQREPPGRSRGRGDAGTSTGADGDRHLTRRPHGRDRRRRRVHPALVVGRALRRVGLPARRCRSCGQRTIGSSSASARTTLCGAGASPMARLSSRKRCRTPRR